MPQYPYRSTVCRIPRHWGPPSLEMGGGPCLTVVGGGGGGGVCMGGSMSWAAVWHWWHQHVCGRLHWQMTPWGLTRRKGWGLRLHRAQLPLCCWLDAKAHQ